MPSLFLLLGRWSFCCSSQHLRGNEVVMNRFFQAEKLLEKTLSARKNIIAARGERAASYEEGRACEFLET